MAEFKSSAQFWQDRFPHELIVRPENKLDGSFLDIGCNDPVNCNNTYGLEQLGWHGVLNDIIPDCVRSCAVRKSPFMLGDARTLDWPAVLRDNGLASPVVDYLSLDVDDAGLEVLVNLRLDVLTFRTITAEHDAYRISNTMRDAMRSLLRGAGYDLVCADVKLTGSPIEDWYIHPGLVDMKAVELIRCDGVEWSEIFSKLA